MKTKIILGPPGTGKTEYLLRKVEEQLEAGINSDRDWETLVSLGTYHK